MLIAGPCVIESEAHASDLAGRLTEIARRARVPFIFKASYDKANRTSGRSFRGPGLDEGLRVLSAFPVGRDVGRDHEVRLWYVQADLLERSARHPEAITVFRRILRVEPDAFDVAERVAALEMRAGDGERGSRRQSTGRGGRAGPFVT